MIKTTRTLPLIINIAVITIFLLFSVISACWPFRLPSKVFHPEENSPFKITFSYPHYWEWKSPPGSMTKTFGAMYVEEPLPTIRPEAPAVRMFVDITVSADSHPRYSMQESINLSMKAIEFLQSKLLDDKTVLIDGRKARWLTVKQKPNIREGVEEATIIEELFFVGGDRYYRIFLVIPEEEMDGRFHTEFKAMLASIEFLPQPKPPREFQTTGWPFIRLY